MRRLDVRKKLERIIDTIDKNRDSLPLTPKQLYVFGSFIKGNQNPHDLDLIFIHEPMTIKQRNQYVIALSRGLMTPERKTSKSLKSHNSEKIDILYGKGIKEVKNLMDGNSKTKLKEGFKFFNELLEVKRNNKDSLYDDDLKEGHLIEFFVKFFESTLKHRKNRGLLWGVREELGKWSTGLDKYVLVWDKEREKIELPECCEWRIKTDIL